MAQLFSLDRMKAPILLLLASFFILCGCESADERLDKANLQPYTNIAPGTLVLVQMRAGVTDYTHINTSGQPRQYDMAIGSEYLFEGISYGSVGLRRTNDTKTIYFAGRMIQSITPKKN